MSSELMTTNEIHAFGLQVLIKTFQEKGFAIEYAQPQKIEIPHIIAKQNDELFFTLSSTDVYPNKGTITQKDKESLIEHAMKFSAKPACAYLGIANADGVVSKDKELCSKAYKNAQFYTDFAGLEMIYFED